MELNRGVSSSDIAAKAALAAFGRPLVTNVHRGLIAEAIIAEALGRSWKWCSADYAAWDFERADGLRLEVKQAASRQSWHSPADKPSRICFDIRARKGRYEGPDWLADNRRFADVYVFAHHYVVDDSVDHRDPRQWTFYVIPENTLPAQKRIALSRISSLAQPCWFHELAGALSI